VHLVRPDAAVCWFLGFTPQHDYSIFEARAQRRAPPSLDDESPSRSSSKSSTSITGSPPTFGSSSPAERSPNQPQRATVGALLRLDVCVELLVVEDDAISDLTISVRLPPVIDGATSPPDWSDVPLLERLVALIDPRRTADQVDWAPTSIPTGPAEEGSTHRRSTLPESWPFAFRTGRCERSVAPSKCDAGRSK
jgi:hypothetical protein